MPHAHREKAGGWQRGVGWAPERAVGQPVVRVTVVLFRDLWRGMWSVGTTEKRGHISAEMSATRRSIPMQNVPSASRESQQAGGDGQGQAQHTLLIIMIMMRAAAQDVQESREDGEYTGAHRSLLPKVQVSEGRPQARNALTQAKSVSNGARW
jgi:hypothetical protein